MDIVVFAQEEPNFMGPMIIKVLEKRAKDIKIVMLFGLREGARKPKGIINNIERIETYATIFGFQGFIKVLKRRMIFSLMKNSKKQNDFFSIRRACKRLNIPLYEFDSMEDSQFRALLSNNKIDVIFNQSDYIISKEVINIPKWGIINRHGSLLPDQKGRMASYWSHVKGEKYGITIHFVIEKVDSGEIIVQRELNLSPKDSYYNIIKDIFEESSKCILEAFSLLENSKFKSRPMKMTAEQTNEFPTLKQALAHRKVFKRRKHE